MASESSLWEAEKPAKLDSVQQRQLRERVRLALADAGYRAAEFELAFAFHDQVADLKIQVVRLGTVAVVAGIDVQGNHKDTDEEIIRYTGLRVGEPWTAQRREAVRVCLLEAARYIEHQIDEQITAGSSAFDDSDNRVSGGTALEWRSQSGRAGGASCIGTGWSGARAATRTWF